MMQVKVQEFEVAAALETADIAAEVAAGVPRTGVAAALGAEAGPAKPTAMAAMLQDIKPELEKETQLARMAEDRPIIAIKRQKETPKPIWHPPWKLMRVIQGHQGWVRCLAVDSSNEWFASSGQDRMIKIWDLASGTLKLSLTG